MKLNAGAPGPARDAGATDDALLREAFRALHRAYPHGRELFAGLGELLRRRIGRDPAWVPRAWEGAIFRPVARYARSQPLVEAAPPASRRGEDRPLWRSVMRRLTSVVAAGALALALGVSTLEVRASEPRTEGFRAGSWFQEVVAQLGLFGAGSRAGSSAGSGAVQAVKEDTGPDMDPNGLTSPGPRSAGTEPPSEQDTYPGMDPNG